MEERRKADGWGPCLMTVCRGESSARTRGRQQELGEYGDATIGGFRWKRCEMYAASNVGLQEAWCGAGQEVGRDVEAQGKHEGWLT